MKVVCRKVDPSDPGSKELLIELQKNCLPHDALYSPDGGHWWIAYHRDTPVGFAALAPSLQTPNAVYLGRCGIVRAARGHNLQQRLIKVRLAWAKRQGYEWAVSDTTDNVPSANNLIACGFKTYEPAVRYSFARAVYWKRKL
jgi:GNAT superfamily N-acetyltransferase